MKKNVAAALAMAVSITAFAGGALAKGGSDVLVPASDLKWADVPNTPGVKMATVDGDPAKGAAHFMIKLAGGFSAPLHHHTADHYVTVLAGTVVLTVDGKEQKLPAGSYFSFRGKKTHVTQCEAGADCLLSIDARGKWDVVPEAAKPADGKAAEKKK